MMKRIKTAFPSKFPNDCWCCVIEFFKKSDNFFNLVLTVKGLLEYVGKINPRCTINIIFHMKKIPYSRNEYVTNLKCKMKELMEVDKIRGCSNFGNFMGRVSYRFPFLERLFVNSGDLSEEEDKSFSDVHIKNNFFHLRLLKLRFERTKSLKITSNLPKLKELDIFRFSQYTETVVVRPAPNLTIEWKKIPCLNVLKLYNWSLCNKISYPDDHVFMDVCIGCTRTIDLQMNIEELKIEDESLIFMKSLTPKHLRCLRKLSLDSCGLIYSLQSPGTEVDLVSSITEIKDYQTLEEVCLNGCLDERWRLDNKDRILLENLPKLKVVKLRRLCFDVLLSNTPKIEILDCEGFKDEAVVDFKNSGDTSNLRTLKIYEEDGIAEIGPILRENILSCKNFDNLELLLAEGFTNTETCISLVGWKKLKEFDTFGDNSKVKEIRDCPCLEKGFNFEAYPDFEVPPAANLPKLRELLFYSPSCFPFFESLGGRKLERLSIECENSEDFHLLARNVCGIKLLEIEDANELVIRGVREFPMVLTELALVGVIHVELCDILSLKKCVIRRNVKVVVINNCPKLEDLSIRNWRKQNEMERIELCHLPSAKRIEIKTYTVIKNLIVSGIPYEMKCSTKIKEFKTTELEEEEEKKKKSGIHLRSIQILYERD